MAVIKIYFVFYETHVSEIVNIVKTHSQKLINCIGLYCSIFILRKYHTDFVTILYLITLVGSVPTNVRCGGVL